jgi:hypothetical protein
VLRHGQLADQRAYDNNRCAWTFPNERARLNQLQAQLLYLAVRVNNSGFCDPALLFPALRGNLDGIQLENRPQRAPKNHNDRPLRFTDITTRPSLKLTRNSA